MDPSIEDVVGEYLAAGVERADTLKKSLEKIMVWVGAPSVEQVELRDPIERKEQELREELELLLNRRHGKEEK